MEILILILFVIAALAHVWNIISKSWRIHQYKSVSTDQQPTISVIVCARNEATNLSQLVPILLNQNYPDFEIIIALDRCTDNSKEIVEQYAADNLRMLLIDTPPDSINPKKYAIEQAIDLAKGEWMLLTDADCRPTLHWITEMAKGMNSGSDVVLGISPYQKKGGFLNLLIQYETFNTALNFISKCIEGKTYMGLGRNLAYRKSTFVEKGGFGSIGHLMGGDDDLLVQRLSDGRNVNVILEPDSWVESIPKTNWANYFQQKTRHFGVSKYYTFASKKSETIRWLIHQLFWVFFSWCLILNWQIASVIFILTFVIKAISINIVSNRLAKRFNHLWMPIVDMGYVVILPLLSLRSLLVKRITWK